MNNVLEASSSGLLQTNYRVQGQQALNHRQLAVQQLLSQRQLPPSGWNELYISSFLNEIALMDSNNFIETVGVGEREGRVFCNMVRLRHYHLSHGIGRSGDLLAQQPKAAGSSLLLTLTHALTLHALRLAGLTEAKQVLLLPVATGMSIVLALTALKLNHPSHLAAQRELLRVAQAAAAPLPPVVTSNTDASIISPSSAASPTTAPTGASTSPQFVPPSPLPSNSSPVYIIWSRIDQKTCLKSIFAAGLIPVVIELKREGDQLVTDLDAIQRAIERLGAHNILAVVSTTSCFAPRAPDKVIEIAKLCARFHLAHVINNAYGIQCSRTCALINSATRKGRVDAAISSMDKNFLVPVGGAMVIGFHSKNKSTGSHHHSNSNSHSNSSSSSVSRAALPISTTAASNRTSFSSNISNNSNSSVGSTTGSEAPISPTMNNHPPLDILQLISSLYPGRASSSSIIDLLMTLLSMGSSGWLSLLSRREALLPKFKARMTLLAESHGERLLVTEDNRISFGFTLDTIDHQNVDLNEAMNTLSPSSGSSFSSINSPVSTTSISDTNETLSSDSANSSSSSAAVAATVPSATSVNPSSTAPSLLSKFVPAYLGSLLFSRNVSGPRCLSSAHATTSTINNVRFQHYGTHSNDYPHAYITAACGIGMHEEEVEIFATRLDKCLKEFSKQKKKASIAALYAAKAKEVPTSNNATSTASSAATSAAASIPSASSSTAEIIQPVPLTGLSVLTELNQHIAR